MQKQRGRGSTFRTRRKKEKKIQNFFRVKQYAVSII
jgi:hypothetical protein